MTTPERMAELTATRWPDGRAKVAPVQGWPQGIPWSLHMKAYAAYCQKYGGQEALIDLAGRGCRGGFSTGELDDFVPGWRNEVSEISYLRDVVSKLVNALEIAKQELTFHNIALPVIRDQIIDGALAAAKECSHEKR